MSEEEHGPELPHQVRLVLGETADIAAERLAQPIDSPSLLRSVEGTRTLLPLLRGSHGLRQLLRARLSGELTDQLAMDLVAQDASVAGHAVARLHQLLDEERKAQRRAGRARRRARRPDAETRRHARQEQRIAQLRGVRDRLEQQLTTLTEENRELRTTIDNLDAELAQLRRQLDAAYARLALARQDGDSEAPSPTIAVGDELSVTVRVLGGGEEIGASCVLVSAGGTRIVVDAGTKPNGIDAASMAPADIAELYDNPPDAIVVTHAHNDHAGWIPALVSRFGRLPVIASTATCDLLGTMWADSVKVMTRRTDNDETWSGGLLPPYQVSDVDEAVAALVDLPIGRQRRVGAVNLELFQSGHIIGATGVVITAGETRVVVSGDVSGPGQYSVGGLQLPEAARGADLMLLESTYAGAGKLPPRDTVINEFVADVDRILGAGGRVLVPAFALGRAQEIALVCQRHLPEAEVLVDGLARDLSYAYRRHDGPDDARVNVFSGKVRAVDPGRTRREINDKRPCVVVATSGMLNGGPAVPWAREILTEEESGLMVVGYQDADSPGSQLLSLAAAGGGTFTLPDADESVPVAAHVGHYRLGAHASEDELVDIAAQASPETLMLVHGRKNAQRQFAKRLALRDQHTIMASQPWTHRTDSAR